MVGILIRWREEPFTCEYQGQDSGGSLSLFDGGGLVHREPVASAQFAYQRAREVRDVLAAAELKRA